MLQITDLDIISIPTSLAIAFIALHSSIFALEALFPTLPKIGSARFEAVSHSIFFIFKFWQYNCSFENRKIAEIAYKTDFWGRLGADSGDIHSKVDSQNEKSKLGLGIPRWLLPSLIGLRRPHALRGWF